MALWVFGSAIIILSVQRRTATYNGPMIGRGENICVSISRRESLGADVVPFSITCDTTNLLREIDDERAHLEGRSQLEFSSLGKTQEQA